MRKSQGQFMKKIALFIMGLLMFQLIYAVDYDVINANNHLIEYTGRIDFSNPLKPRFSYSGVSVRACFQGTSIAMMLSDEGNQNQYNVILDNEIIARIQTKTGQNTYSLAAGLKDTIHEIELFKLTEQSFGKTQFCGYIVDKGKTLVEISDKREHLIEFIGNSITCGYGNEGVLGGTFSATTENHYLTYAAIASRSFNARHLGVCKSGIGIYRNYDGPVAGSVDCMPNYYQRVYLYDATPLYTFTQKPDLICIDLGTNDFSTGKGDSAKYVNKYLQFIDTLQLKTSGADIICLLGPMLGGTDLSRIRKYLNYIVDSASNKNHGKVSFFEMSQQTGSLGIAIDYHPTVAQHLKNAKELIKSISTLKGWPVCPRLIMGSTKLADEIVLEFSTELQDVSGNFNGFTVWSDNVLIPVSRVYPDQADHSKIHILLATSLAAGKKTSISYSASSVATISNVKLAGIPSFSIANALTETKLTGAVTDQSGSKITLSFDKTMILPLNLNGLLLFNPRNTALQVDRFVLSSKSIDIYLKNKIAIGDTVFMTLSDGFFSTDKVAVTPVVKRGILNNSISASIVQNNTAPMLIYSDSADSKRVNYSIGESNPEKVMADLYDLRGNRMVRKILGSSSGKIDLNSTVSQSGMYILKISTSKKQYSKVIFIY
jgi:hypothetical protein